MVHNCRTFDYQLTISQMPHFSCWRINITLMSRAFVLFWGTSDDAALRAIVIVEQRLYLTSTYYRRAKSDSTQLTHGFAMSR
jgi:hypothetical protein